MSSKVLWSEVVEFDAPEILAGSLVHAMEQNSQHIMTCRSYLDKFSYPGAVAILVDDDEDEEDKSAWFVVILESMVEVGEILT